MHILSSQLCGINKDNNVPVVTLYTCNINIAIVEGKYHQLKRMFGTLGNKILKLERVQIGDDFILDGLKAGEWRDLKSDEIKKYL